MREVTWKITEVDENTGYIRVHFVDGTHDHESLYKWDGNRDELVQRINFDASQLSISWKDSPVLIITKLELLQMTGSSNDYSTDHVINDSSPFVEI